MLSKSWATRFRGLFLTLLSCQSLVALAAGPQPPEPPPPPPTNPITVKSKVFDNGKMTGLWTPVTMTDVNGQARIFEIKDRYDGAGVKIYQKIGATESVVNAGGNTNGLLSAFTVALRSDGCLEIAGLGDDGRAVYITRETEPGSGAFTAWYKAVDKPSGSEHRDPKWTTFWAKAMDTRLEYGMTDNENKIAGLYAKDIGAYRTQLAQIAPAYTRTIGSDIYFCNPNAYRYVTLPDSFFTSTSSIAVWYCVAVKRSVENGNRRFFYGNQEIKFIREDDPYTVNFLADGRYEIATISHQERVFGNITFVRQNQILDVPWTQFTPEETSLDFFKSRWTFDSYSLLWENIQMTATSGYELRYNFTFQVNINGDRTSHVVHYNHKDGISREYTGADKIYVYNSGKPLVPNQFSQDILDNDGRRHKFFLGQDGSVKHLYTDPNSNYWHNPNSNNTFYSARYLLNWADKIPMESFNNLMNAHVTIAKHQNGNIQVARSALTRDNVCTFRVYAYALDSKGSRSWQEQYDQRKSYNASEPSQCTNRPWDQGASRDMYWSIPRQTNKLVYQGVPA